MIFSSFAIALFFLTQPYSGSCFSPVARGIAAVNHQPLLGRDPSHEISHCTLPRCRHPHHPTAVSSPLFATQPKDGLDSLEKDCASNNSNNVHKRRVYLFMRLRSWLSRLDDTLTAAGLSTDPESSSHTVVLQAGVLGRLKQLHNPKTYLVLAAVAGFRYDWCFRNPYYWFAVGFCIKWYRARYVFKIPVWDRQPNWNNIITSKEQEKDLKAFTCKNCGFFFEGNTGIGGLGCFSCGAKGKDNFVMDRERILEDVGDLDDYFEYERPLDFVSRAERRKLLKETKGDEEAANKLLLERVTGTATTTTTSNTEADATSTDVLDAEIVTDDDKADEAEPIPSAMDDDQDSSDENSDDDDDTEDKFQQSAKLDTAKETKKLKFKESMDEDTDEDEIKVGVEVTKSRSEINVEDDSDDKMTSCAEDISEKVSIIEESKEDLSKMKLEKDKSEQSGDILPKTKSQKDAPEEIDSKDDSLNARESKEVEAKIEKVEKEAIDMEKPKEAETKIKTVEEEKASHVEEAKEKTTNMKEEADDLSTSRGLKEAASKKQSAKQDATSEMESATMSKKASTESSTQTEKVTKPKKSSISKKPAPQNDDLDLDILDMDG
jgi:hypothetical protein